MDRPKSASDANALMPAPASPTKGILMTPGTAAAKKKNVTFGDHVVDNQEKRPLKSGLPDDCPGKFPSPWNKQAGAERDGPAEKGRGRNKLTEALEQARDESRQRRGEGDFRNANEGREGSPAPENDCCAYWRREYDVYRTNTQREVKKLVKKYKAAKDYAQSKDDEASDLRLHLQEAETKADALEEAVNLLTTQIKEMEEQMRAQSQTQPKAETLVPPPVPEKPRDRPRDLLALLERKGSNQRTVSSNTVRTTENDQLQRPSEPRPSSSRRAQDFALPKRPAEASKPVDKGKDDVEPQGQPQHAAAAEKTIPHSQSGGRTPATIAARWAAVKEPIQRASEPTPAHTKREGQTFNVRRQAEATNTDAVAATDQKPGPAGKLADSAPDTTDDLFLPSEPAVYSPPVKTTTPRPATVEDEASSPPPPAPPAHASGTISERPKLKERQDSGAGGTLRPMSANARSGSGGAAGTDGGSAGEGKRVGRDGKEIDPARLEAARARIKARGRDVS